VQQHDLARFHFQGSDAEHLTARITYQVERHPFDEKLGARPDVSLVEGVQHRMAGTVRRAAGALHRALAEILE